MNRQEFYTGTRENLKKGVEQIDSLQDRVKQLKTDYANCTDYKKRQNLQNEISKTEHEVSEVAWSVEKQNKELAKQYTESLKEMDILKPGELNQEDLTLLNSGIQLNTNDYKAMLDRNKDNRTMTQAIIRNAESKGFKGIGSYIPSGSKQNIRAEIDGISKASEIVLKHTKNSRLMHNLYNELFPGSQEE